jgi:hypothetical protein
VTRFIRVPYPIYRGSPHWTPTLVPDIRRQLDLKGNPFYKENEAACFVAVKDGADVGRLCAIHPRYANRYFGREEGWFYHFDVIDDEAVAHALFDKAAAWASERGLSALRGPLGFMAADGLGMLTAGFDEHASVGISYNHPYYVAYTESWGFEKQRAYHSGYINIPRMRTEFPQKVLRLAEKIRARHGFEVRTFPSMKAIRREVLPQLIAVYNTSFDKLSNYPPIPDELVETIIANLTLIAPPDLLKFVMRGDQLAGFLFIYPDIYAALQRTGGRVFPTGFLHILAERRRTKWLNFNGIGMLPEYQGQGGPAVIYAELYDTMYHNYQFEHVEAVQIAEHNAKSLNELIQFGARIHKTHAIFKKEL